MKVDELLKCIGDIDDNFVEEAAGGRARLKRIPWGMIASAACLCLVIASVIFLHSSGLLSVSTEPTEGSDPVVTTTVPSETTLPTETTQDTRPSVEAFFSDRSNWQNYVVMTTFSRPEDMNIHYLFVRPIDGESTEPTDLERELLPELMERYDPLLLFRSTEEQMNEVLLTYFNITTDQLTSDWKSGFTYLEETGCYYTLVPQGVGYYVSIDRTEECDDGTILMYYTLTNDPDAEPDRVARLQPHDTGYYILSNENYVDNTGKTEEQIAMEAMFGDIYSWYNRALTCEYENPEQLSLINVFYSGFSGESQQPTEEEWAQLKDKPGFNENYDLFRLPVSRMNEVLIEYFGITLEDIPDEGFKGLTYLESTDCWYFMTTGWFGIENFEALAVESLSDGNIQVLYDAGYRGQFVVTLQPNGDGYRILSNLPAE